MSNKPVECRIRFRYRGGSADNNMLDLYGGTKSIHGFARAAQIATHGFVNHSIINHSTALKGARMYLRPAQRGSYLTEIFIEILNSPIPSGVAAAAFYDFVKVTFGLAVGKDYPPATPAITKLNTKDEPFFDSLAEEMEGPLVDAHRTIQETGGTVTLERPRSELVTFDRETLSWVKTQEEDPIPEIITGSVTRYNVLSKNGRLYDHSLEKVIPFKPLKNGIPAKANSLLTWSMDQINNGLPGPLSMTVKRIRSARGSTKRFILLDCRKHEES